MDEPDWRQVGDYVAGECPNCGRERLLNVVDPQGRERVICEKCDWEPAESRYSSEDTATPHPRLSAAS